MCVSVSVQCEFHYDIELVGFLRSGHETNGKICLLILNCLWNGLKRNAFDAESEIYIKSILFCSKKKCNRNLIYTQPSILNADFCQFSSPFKKDRIFVNVCAVSKSKVNESFEWKTSIQKNWQSICKYFTACIFVSIDRIELATDRYDTANENEQLFVYFLIAVDRMMLLVCSMQIISPKSY